jgi:hypothetical protein
MRKWLVGLGVVALLVAAGIATAVASTRSADITAPQRIHAIELPIKTTFTDLNAKGPSQGDLFVATNKLVDPADHSRVIGHEDDTCTVASAASGRFECTSTAFFPSGSVMAVGPFNLGGTARLAVAGGTGLYRNARGQLIARDLGQEHADVVFLLIP